MSFLASVPLLVLAPAAQAQPAEGSTFRYEVDLTDHADDLFHVTIHPGALSAEDRFLDFVAFAPGVHSPLRFGRFVGELSAFDADGSEIAIEKVDENRWEIAAPTRVARIAYTIEDSFDTEIQEDRVIPCGGTGIEDTYVLLNTFGVLGYFENHLRAPVELRLEHDPEWLIGTALKKDRDGVYRSASYRELADSPVLMGPPGPMTTTGIWVGDIEVEIFVHSTNPELNAEEILFVAGDILVAAERFIGFAPVDRYVFLMAFIDADSMRRNRFRSMGALEHSYSSVYTLPAFAGSLDGISQTVSHEFMHILTPLHLKSTIIAEFDYSIPTTDRHLWLYEGLTEWSSDMVRLRGGVVGLDRHLQALTQKIRTARAYDPEYSLARLSSEWATPEGGRQYGNIYQLGALTCAVLDIRILELSGGEKGLREVFLELLSKFGRQRPFDDETFFDELVSATYPEIADFVRDHIEGHVPLPYEAAFAKVGIDYSEGRGLTEDPDCSPEQLALRQAWIRSLAED